MRDLSLYIHIPFCVRKCLYCDFLSFPLYGDSQEGCGTPSGEPVGGHDGADRMRSYVNLLRREIRETAPDYRGHRVISVFFGGGTPSVLPAGEIAAVMEEIGAHYALAEGAEITIEANPGTADERKLQEYIAGGINRISIGLQSADAGELKRIGRIHDYAAFLHTYEAVRDIGFCNVNVDLMAALPEQSTASYLSSLERVAALRPEHISAYGLILEEGTPLYERRSSYRFPDEDEEREMYGLTKTVLAAAGYHRYEISNYAREGFECRHNKVYWQRGDYVGFGLGASSMVQNERWSNPKDMAEYGAYVDELARRRCAGARHGCVQNERTGEYPENCAEGVRTAEGTFFDRQALTRREQMEERMFLGLRMMCGVDENAFLREFGMTAEAVYGAVLDKLCRQDLIVRRQGRIRLTDFGIDVSNYVMAQFLLD